jgi:16S rRNA (guanine527-N7)-methyltransferase
MSGPKLLRSNVLPPEKFGPEEFATLAGVSRETLSRLKLFVSLLAEWNSRLNLVSSGSLEDVWRRHMWDSAQLAPLIPAKTETLVDLGTGAGFPGLVLALVLRERGALRTVLYEATTKKCSFLAEAASRTGAPVEIRNGRIEKADREPFDVVTSRACAPMAKLLAYAQPFQKPATINLFLKGQSVGVELTEARKSWKMKLLEHPSRSDPSGVIVEVQELRYVSKQR